MVSGDPRRRLIVNADDFGRSASINAAVIGAHQHGILTTASLMVNGEAFMEAVQLARANPKLGVGLHLTLCCGRSALPPARIPDLVSKAGAFRSSPVSAGMKYFFSADARRQLELEIAAQFEKFEAAGLALDHVNGHLHFHLHPAVFSILQRHFQKWKVRAVRLTYDPVPIDWSLGQGRIVYRASHAVIFKLLAGRARPILKSHGIACTSFVCGIL